MSGQHDGYARSGASFRPSVYSTGVQSVQPYGTGWMEGADYGGWSAELYKYTPLGYVFDRWASEQESSAGGACVDHDGKIGPAGAKVDCHKLAQAMGVKPASDSKDFSLADLVPDALKPDAEPLCDAKCQQEKRLKSAATVTVAVLLSIGSLVAFQRYRRTGKVF